MIKFKKENIFLNKFGFMLIELLVVISIMGFLLTASIFVISKARMSSRDAMRVTHAKAVEQALAMYLNDHSFYPVSEGECLSNNGVGDLLKKGNVMSSIPLDPVWPTIPPGFVDEHGAAGEGSANFCYYYASDGVGYYFSYYLESNFQSGEPGIHTIIPPSI